MEDVEGVDKILNKVDEEKRIKANDFLEKVRGTKIFVQEPRDYSPSLFDIHETAWTREDYDKGIESPQEKYNIVIIQTLASAGIPLVRSKFDEKPEVIDKLYDLATQRPLFVPITDEKLHEDVKKARTMFDTEETGVIVKLLATGEFETILQTFPAVKKGGKMYRILQSSGIERMQPLQKAFFLLTFPSELKADKDNVVAIVEFVEGPEMPSKITKSELDDWVDRVRQSQVEFGLDIGHTDNLLDNLLRYNSRLYWCDGNLMGAKPVDNQRAIEIAQEHKDSLQRFVSEN